MTATQLAAFLLSLLKVDRLEAFVHPPEFASEISLRPIADRLARWQAFEGDNVTTRRHRAVRLEPLARKVLCLLDGTHDKAAIVEALQGELRRQTIWFEQKGGGRIQPNAEQVTEMVESTLRYFRDHALLIA